MVAIRSRLGASWSIVLALAASGCAHSTVAPPHPAAKPCETAGALAGRWESARPGQLGAASMSLRLGCDCTYTMKTRVLWQSIRESGVYWIDDGRLLFTRASGEVTAWPYALVGERLTLTEAAGETHDYQRKASLRCP